MNQLGLRALRHVALWTPSLVEAREFYTEGWGLEPVHDSHDRLCLRGTGPEHHILELATADQMGLGHISFAVATQSDVDAAAARVQSLGITIAAEPHNTDEPGGGYQFGFRDPEGRLVVLSALVAAVAPRSTDSARPVELSHVVLNTVDIDAATEFWTEIVGLRVSDWSEHQMVFLRCNSRHHSIAFNQADWTSVNHVAYELASIDAYMRRIGHLRHRGHSPLWGPGRHGPGNNAFAYYGDPAGFVPELTTGLEEIDESSWVPRVWQRVPDQSDLWGTAGPPSAELRTRMAGAPDPASPSGQGRS